jgi:hypothetical protein
MATPDKAREMRGLETTSEQDTECVVTTGKECQDLLHLGLKAPLLCFLGKRKRARLGVFSLSPCLSIMSAPEKQCKIKEKWGQTPRGKA